MGEVKKNSWKAKFKGGPKDIFLGTGGAQNKQVLDR